MTIDVVPDEWDYHLSPPCLCCLYLRFLFVAQHSYWARVTGEQTTLVLTQAIAVLTEYELLSVAATV